MNKKDIIFKDLKGNKAKAEDISHFYSQQVLLEENPNAKHLEELRKKEKNNINNLLHKK